MSTKLPLHVSMLWSPGLLLGTCVMLTAQNLAESELAPAARSAHTVPAAATLTAAMFPEASHPVARFPANSMPVAALSPTSLRLPFLTHRRVLACKNGCATFYSRNLNGGRSADGGRVDLSKFTAAHRSYPFGTVLRVTRVKTGVFVEVRVTDRLPSTRTNDRLGIIVDLTHAAASKLDMMRDGRVKVKVEVLEWGGKKGKGTGMQNEKELASNS